MEEVKKKNSYDKWWLHQDMENMGYLFEYCDKYCKELFNIDIDKHKFLNKFMNSNIRYEMETGHPMLLSQAAKDTVEKFITVDCDNNTSIFRGYTNKDDYWFNQFYWVGWMYAYLHYEEDILSRDLVKILPLDTMLQQYHLGHEVSLENYHDRVKYLFEEWRAQQKK